MYMYWQESGGDKIPHRILLFSCIFIANTFRKLSVNNMGSKQNVTAFMKTPFPVRYILYRATVSLFFS
jgi:hypothetical protein